MRYIGFLKPEKWFLGQGWNECDNGIQDSIGDFVIYYDELSAELILKEIPFDRWYGLELEDENGTQYKKEWFQTLEEIEEDYHV